MATTLQGNHNIRAVVEMFWCDSAKIYEAIGAAGCSQDMCVWVCVRAHMSFISSDNLKGLGVETCLGLGVKLLFKVRVRGWVM